MEEATRRESLRLGRQTGDFSAGAQFDINKCIHLIPPFSEKDNDKYFVVFERVAQTLRWLRDVWSLLLQCVFTGKAQEAHASLSPEDSRL